MKKSITIIGGGPAAMLLAAHVDTSLYDVTIFEKNKALGRKFLVAGKGGFNLTHSEPVERLVARYTPTSFLEKALNDFDNNAFRAWLETIGISTYIGSSKRVYPEKDIKPIEVLKAIETHMNKKGISIQYEKTWTGWDAKNALIFNETELITSDYVVFALGGGSWKVTGSDGTWLDIFKKKGIKTASLEASNCAGAVDWPAVFLAEHEGLPLKNIAISCDEKTQKGEAVITRFGLEGNALYGLSPQIRAQLNNTGQAEISMDLKPMLTAEHLLRKTQEARYKNTTAFLKKDLKLSATQVALLKNNTSKEEFLNPKTLALRIKNLPLRIRQFAPMDEAISTVGGIRLDAVDATFQLKKLPNHFCIGEMLDWDTPTGGYLLQGCASMGVQLARFFNSKA